jgi:hypothetical protein
MDLPAHKAITERGGKDCKSELKISVEGKLQNWNFKIKISYTKNWAQVAVEVLLDYHPSNIRNET